MTCTCSLLRPRFDSGPRSIRNGRTGWINPAAGPLCALCAFLPAFQISILRLFFCGGPGVVRPSATYLSSSFVSRATISGCSCLTLVRSPTSAAQIVKLDRRQLAGVVDSGRGKLQPPEPGQSSSFQFPCWIENEPSME